MDMKCHNFYREDFLSFYINEKNPPIDLCSTGGLTKKLKTYKKKENKYVYN